MTNPDWLQNLNPPQREAVLHFEGPLLVLAGAGSGKTRVLTHRVAHLIDVHRVAPEAILALTFTNRAAAEMRHRVDDLLRERPGAASRVLLSTFHSLGARLLRQYAPRAGLDWNFSIFDDSDQRRLISEILQRKDMDKSSSEIRARQSFIDAQKNRSLSPKEALERAFDARAEENALFYQDYQDALAAAGAVDFGDLILAVNLLFRDHPDLARRLSQRWQFLMVDEFQDTNPAQYELLHHLTSAHRNLTVVGDDDQAIYGWRGAEPAHILGFKNAFEDAAVVKLEQNYRSTSLILDAANDVIAHNHHRHPKRLWTAAEGGEKILLFTGADDREEASYVSETIFDLLRQGTDPEEIAVFYRANAQGRSFEEQLRQWGVPYRIVGGLSFYAREEIKDLLAYLRAAINPDDDVATARVINTPRRGIGDATVEKLRNALRIDGVDNLQDAIELLDADSTPTLQHDLFAAGPRPRGPAQQQALAALQSLRGVSRNGLQAFSQLLEATRDDLLHFESLLPIVERLLERTHYTEYVKNSDPERAEDRLRNLGELLNAIDEFERDPATPALLEALRETIPDDEEDPLLISESAILLRAFLDRSTLVQNADSENDDSDGRAVTLMTIHGSKGLEFDHVFLVGMEEETFPNMRNGNDPDELDEERRLAYVAITRARQRLFLTNARRRRTYGQFRNTEPSRFLLHIDPSRLFLDPRSNSREIDYARRSATSSSGAAFEQRHPSSTALDYDQSEPSFQDAFNQAPPQWNEVAYADEVAELVASAPSDDADQHLVGLTVSHSKFGVGEVLSVSGSGDKALLSVDFPAVGTQSVYRRFLKVLG